MDRYTDRGTDGRRTGQRKKDNEWEGRQTVRLWMNGHTDRQRDSQTYRPTAWTNEQIGL
jgi:hypothetical protein